MSKSIGIIDSGLGGYTLYHGLRAKYPKKSFTLIVDQANAPFGDKTKDELLEIGKKLLTRMSDLNIETVLIGCNTLSASVYRELVEAFPHLNLINIIDLTIQEVSPEVNRVLVIATTTTINQKAYSSALTKHAKNAWINELATPKLVPLIEGLADDKDVDEILGEYLEGKTNVDTLILGCTHYPLIKNNLQKLSKAQIIDSIDASIHYFDESDLEDGESQIFTSHDAKRLENQIFSLFNTKQEVKEIVL